MGSERIAGGASLLGHGPPMVRSLVLPVAGAAHHGPVGPAGQRSALEVGVPSMERGALRRVVSAAPAAGAGDVPRVRRSGVASLPVSGNGSMAAGVASSVAQGIAQDIARTTVDEVVVRRVEEVLTQRSAGEASAEAGVTQVARLVQRAGDEPDEVSGSSTGSQHDAWMRFASSEEFQDRLMELLEDRLMGEIERRGGRYGGWFA